MGFLYKNVAAIKEVDTVRTRKDVIKTAHLTGNIHRQVSLLRIAMKTTGIIYKKKQKRNELEDLRISFYLAHLRI